MSLPDYRAYIASPIWAEKRKAVLKQRGCVCEICRNVSGKPQVHHLHYQRLGCEYITDLQVLCNHCHEREHKLRPRESFRDAKSLLSYLETLTPKELSYRFPRCWNSGKEPAKPTRESYSSKNRWMARTPRISADGLTFTLKPKSNAGLNALRFAAISAAGFKCQDCGRPVKADTAIVVDSRYVTCGCKMAAEYIKKIFDNFSRSC